MGQLDDLDQRLKEAIQTVMSDEYCKKYSELLAKQVKKRARLGYSVEENNKEQNKFKKLQDSTIANRKYLKTIGKLNPDTTPFTANVTRSGQLLDQIIPKGKTNYIIVGFDEKRNDGNLNSEIVRYLKEKGFPFFHFADYEKTLIEREIYKDIRKLLKKK